MTLLASEDSWMETIRPSNNNWITNLCTKSFWRQLEAHCKSTIHGDNLHSWVALWNPSGMKKLLDGFHKAIQEYKVYISSYFWRQLEAHCILDHSWLSINSSSNFCISIFPTINFWRQLKFHQTSIILPWYHVISIGG